MPGPSTVSEITKYIKGLFARDFVLARAFVTGEVSNCSYHSSGHIYFTLKDSTAQLDAVMFAGDRAGLKFCLENGQQVCARGRISVYERSGKYQLYAQEITPAGEGELYRRYLLLKQKLEDMGMFDELYKKPLPPYALSIGIVTAPGGAALQDIINISKRRNPYVRLVLCPAAVQGEGASDTIARGIRALDSLGLDVIIVGRGGGSIEDLWAFNEENVAQAIFDAYTPIVSAVGHETDFTIADFVADRRAPTPSAAAEITNFVFSEFEEELSYRKDSLRGAMDQRLREAGHALELDKERLKNFHPGNVITRKKEWLADRQARLGALLERRLSAARQSLEIMAVRMEGASPLKKIGKGYSYLCLSSGKPVKSVSDAAIGETILSHLSDGIIESRVMSIRRINNE